MIGVDISHHALELACQNRSIYKRRPENQVNILKLENPTRQQRSNISFYQADILANNGDERMQSLQPGKDDALHCMKNPTFNESFHLVNGRFKKGVEVLISNPPYISPSSYRRETARSVRDFEPKLALVPPESQPGHDLGDSFYPRLIELTDQLSVKMALFEVADMAQATRVVAMALDGLPPDYSVEIWRDEPSQPIIEEVSVAGKRVRVVGEGNGRSVFIQREGAQMGLERELVARE